jgi:hypothetical protein
MSAPMLRLWLQGALILKFIIRDLVRPACQKLGIKGCGVSTGNAEFLELMILKLNWSRTCFKKKLIRIGSVEYGLKISEK